ncbi:MAG: hypothetical protein ACR2LX_11245 [Jatrophihabitans sp.]
MSLLRDDARQACAARRARTWAEPARFIAPALITCALAAVTAVLLLATGSPVLEIVVAVATIALGAAAVEHRTTASLFYGVAMRLIQPVQSGDRVRLYSTESQQFIDAMVVRIGLVNTTLAMDSGVLVVPNTRMLRTPCAPARGVRTSQSNQPDCDV